MNIKVKTGSNQLLADLVALAVEPHCPGLEFPREVFSATDVFEDGLPLLHLRYLVLTAAQYTSVLTALGVATAKTATVTILVPGDDRSTGTRYNGQAVRPDHGAGAAWQQPLYRSVEILVRRLKAST